MGLTDCSWMYIAILDKIVYTFSKPFIYQAFKINKMFNPPCNLCSGVIAICGLIQDFVDFVCDVVNDCFTRDACGNILNNPTHNLSQPKLLVA